MATIRISLPSALAVTQDILIEIEEKLVFEGLMKTLDDN
jgi:hypothetical protein